MPQEIYARWESQDTGLTVAHGEAGIGVYAFLDRDKAMDQHYAEKDSRRRVRFVLPISAKVLDLRRREHRSEIASIAREIGAGFKVTLENMERAFWSITTYLERHHPDCVAYIVPHYTPSVRSLQVVVRKPELIEELSSTY